MIYVCSPYSGDIEKNVSFAKECCRKICEFDEIPIAPHLYFTQFLDDSTAIERKQGMMFGLRLLDLCKEIWVFGNTIIWFKHGGGLGDLKHSLSTDYEIAIVCHKGKCQIRGKREGSVWEINKMNPNKMLHPTQKPDALMEKLIEKFSDEGDIILDPFLGSGTTAVAAVNTNRHYIGYELDNTYFDVCCQRLNEAEDRGGIIG